MTDTSRTDTVGAGHTVTDATPSNRTADGNARRPAGTDPFGPTTTAETDGSGPDFGMPLTMLALVVLTVLVTRRTD